MRIYNDTTPGLFIYSILCYIGFIQIKFKKNSSFVFNLNAKSVSTDKFLSLSLSLCITAVSGHLLVFCECFGVLFPQLCLGYLHSLLENMPSWMGCFQLAPGWLHFDTVTSNEAPFSPMLHNCRRKNIKSNKHTTAHQFCKTDGGKYPKAFNKLPCKRTYCTVQYGTYTFLTLPNRVLQLNN